MDNGTSADSESAKSTYDRLREMFEEAGIDENAFNEKTEKRYSPDFPQIVSATSLLREPPPKRPELIHGLLYEGDKLILGGASKTNKTWISLDLAISVANGVPWWGHETVRAPVLYANFELQPFSIARRLRLIAEAKKIDPNLHLLDVWNLRGYACDAATFVDHAITRIGYDDYGLIIIDPNYKLLGDRNENEAGDVASLCNLFEKLAVKTGAAIMFAAHFSKGNQAGKSSIDRIGGSGVFTRDADAILTITPHEDNNAFVVEPTLRDFPQVKPFGVRWQFPLVIPDLSLDPERLRTKGRSSQYSEHELLDVLPEEGFKYSDWFKAVKENTGMSESTFKNLKRKLEGNDKVERVGNRYKAVILSTTI
jgi:hypothetical protein